MLESSSAPSTLASRDRAARLKTDSTSFDVIAIGGVQARLATGSCPGPRAPPPDPARLRATAALRSLNLKLVLGPGGAYQHRMRPTSTWTKPEPE